jgi:O-antigen/teichoic acid export membrane protein
VVSFGQKIIVIDILQQLAGNGQEIVMGRMLGFTATGLFSRGAGLINLFKRKFQSAVSSVAYPAFAERSRQGRDVNGLFAKSIAYLTGVAWPFYAFSAIMAYPIILAAYGTQWIAAAPVLRILAIAQIIATLSLYTGKLQMATGHINSFLFTRLIVHPTRLALTIAAAFYSIEAVAAVQVVMAFINLALQYWKLHQNLDLQFMTVLRGTYKSAAITVISSLVPLAILALVLTDRLDNPWVELFVAGTGWGAGWLIGLFALKHPLAEEITSAWAHVAKRFYLRQSY